MYPRKTNLTAQYVRTRLVYNKKTGKLYYKPKKVLNNKDRLTFGWNTRCAGKEAGSVIKEGYVSVSLDGVSYQAHRLIWLIVKGKWPTKDIDHEDTNKKNNKWKNLRLAKYSENGFNRGKPKNNKSGYKGVSWSKESKKWFVQIGVNGKGIYLGTYHNKIVAYNAYVKAAKKYHKEFSRVN